MAYSSCSCHPQISPKIGYFKIVRPRRDIGVDQRLTISLGFMSTGKFGQRVARLEAKPKNDWGFVEGSKVTVRPKFPNSALYRKCAGVNVSCSATSQIASSVFTMGTAAVLPFYTLMVLAPRARLTRKFMDSSIPYVVLGLLYTYLLFLSWTPDTIRYMFASKYLLPELSGIAKMFSSELTLASAWVHLLTIDLFAARFFMMD